MRASEVISLIIEAHELQIDRPILLSDRVKVTPQIRYSGKMARDAYNGNRATKHRNRPYCGILDFKIEFDSTNAEHEKHMIRPAVCYMDIDQVREIHNGQSPDDLGLMGTELYDYACTLQAGFIEQELNWGEESFQLKTYFGDPNSKDDLLRESAPRDYLMTYIERCHAEKALGMDWASISAHVIGPFRHWSSEAGNAIVYPPIRKGQIVREFRDYLPCEIFSKPTEKWIDSFIQEVNQLCEALGENPAYVKVSP